MATRTSSRSRSSGATRVRTESRGRRRNTPFDVFGGTVLDERMGPGLAVLFTGVAGQAFHRFWGEPPAVYLVAPLTVLLGLGFYPLVYAQSHGRRRFVRVHSALSGSSALVAVGLTTAFGLHIEPRASGWYVSTWTQVFVFCGIFWALSWVPPTFGAVSGYGDDDRPVEAESEFDKILSGVKVKVEKVAEDGPRKEWKVTHRGIDSLPAGVSSIIRSKAGLPQTGWRQRSDVDDSGVTYVTTVSRDVLRKPTDFPGPSRPGGSCAEPARVGLREDGKPAEIVRPGDGQGRQSSSLLVAGVTGSGKTDGVLCEVAELITRRDVVIWWIDVRKPGQSVPDFRPAIDWCATTDAQATAMARALTPVIQERTAMLGELGYTEWLPECWEKYGIPYLVVHLEEATTTLERLGTAFTRGIEAVRSAGMSISNSLQRPSATNIPTDLRSQFGLAWCFGMREDVDAGMILSDDTIDAGARPEAWKNKRAGYCYLEANHEDEEFWSMPKRTFRMKREILAAITAEWSRRMAVLDPRSAAAAGPAYAERERVDFDQWLSETVARRGKKVRQAAERGTVALRENPPVRPDTSGGRVAASVPAPRPAASAERFDGALEVPVDEEEITDEELMREISEGAEVLQDLPGEDELDQPFDELGRDFPVGPVVSEEERLKYTPKERAEAFVQMLAELYSQGLREISVAEAMDRFSELPEGKVTPNWAYWRFNTLEERTGLVTSVTDDEGNPVSPRSYYLTAGLSSLPGDQAPTPETDPESPVSWSSGEAS